MRQIAARPLRYEIKADDVLVHLHIPKTGGLSLIAVLDSQFAKEEICPLHATPPEMVITDHFTPQQLANFRLVHGHFIFGPYDRLIYRYIARNPLLITLLREPIGRTLSAYAYQKEQGIVPSDTTLHQWLANPEMHSEKNIQSRMIVGALPGIWPSDANPEMLDDEVLYRLAVEQLESMPYFGLTERYRESLRLLCYTFGWPVFEEPPHINETANPTKANDIDEAARAIIHSHTSVDERLYAYAQTLFQKRYQQMIDELLLREYTLRQNVKDHGLHLQKLPTPTATILPPKNKKSALDDQQSTQIPENAKPLLSAPTNQRVRILRTLRWGLMPRGTRREALWLTLKHYIRSKK